MPRHYDSQEEERKLREERIKAELNTNEEEAETVTPDYRTRITGSFKTSRSKQRKAQGFSPSAAIIRSIILLALVLMLIAYLHYGSVSLYLLLLLLPVYIWVRFVRK